MAWPGSALCFLYLHNPGGLTYTKLIEERELKKEVVEQEYMRKTVTDVFSESLAVNKQH